MDPLIAPQAGPGTPSADEFLTSRTELSDSECGLSKSSGTSISRFGIIQNDAGTQSGVEPLVRDSTEGDEILRRFINAPNVPNVNASVQENLHIASTAQALVPVILNQAPYRIRGKLDLPMIIHQSIVISRPDSGSEDNIMVLDLAQSLNLEVNSAPEHQKGFRMANGKIVKAVGRTVAECSFAKDPAVSLRCLFYVFHQLVTPLIMGMDFLNATQTLAAFRHRLEPRAIKSTMPLQICSLDLPRRRLYCLADSQPKLANADTGSDIDLMSLAYVQKRGFVTEEIEPWNSVVQFADGSLTRLLGKVQVKIEIGTGSSAQSWKKEFYVFDGLTCDILLGEDFLHSTAVFQFYSSAFALDAEDDGVCEVNAIVWFNIFESNLARVFNSSTGRLNLQSLKQRFYSGNVIVQRDLI